MGKRSTGEETAGQKGKAAGVGGRAGVHTADPQCPAAAVWSTGLTASTIQLPAILSHLTGPERPAHAPQRGTGQRGGRAEIWPRSLQKPSPHANQKQRCGSHFPSAHQGFAPRRALRGRGHKGWCCPALGLSAAAADWGRGTSAVPSAPPPASPAHPGGGPNPSLRAPRLPPPSFPLSQLSMGHLPSQRGTCISKSETCSSAHQEPICGQHLSKCVLG